MGNYHVQFLKGVFKSYLNIDACPGRLNQTSVFIDRPGVYYGQCSEIC